MLRSLSTFLVLAALAVSVNSQSCPNGCSGHGTCDSKLTCQCHFGKLEDNNGNDVEKTSVTNTDGQTVIKYTYTEDVRMRLAQWTGPDCSLMTCPRGTSWSNIAKTKTGVAKHVEGRECSDMGTCDRDSGSCNCHDGYTGSACQRTKCANNCNGHGICKSNTEFAEMYARAMTIQLNENSLAPIKVETTTEWAKAEAKDTPRAATFGNIDNIYNGFMVTYKNAWDAGKNYGCHCDQGWRGPDCSIRECASSFDAVDQNCKNGNVNIETVIEGKYGAMLGTTQFGFTSAEVSNFIKENYGVKKVSYHPQQYLVSHNHYVDQVRKCSGFHTPSSLKTSDFPTNKNSNRIFPFNKDSWKCSRHVWMGNIIMTPYCGGAPSSQPCSGRGKCSNALGQCVCFQGYSGKGCGDTKALS